jgi:hypothetical protein
MALLSVETGAAVTIGDCGVAIAMQFRTLNLIRAALSKILSEDFLKDGIKSYMHDKIVSGCIKSDALCLLGLIPKCLREHLAIQNLFPAYPIRQTMVAGTL